MTDYLTKDHPDAHVDYAPLVTNERGSATEAVPPGHVTCPKCDGWGGHNLALNQYNHWQATMPDTPENRHKFCHFRCSCDQCSGWGHVPISDSKCVHDYKRWRTIGNCLNEYRCERCAKIIEVDSSD